MFGLFRDAPRVGMRTRMSFRPAVDALEERSVPAVFTVTNQSDHNPGSLRAAVRLANDKPGADTIRFTPGFDATIVLTTGEIDITGNLVIEGRGAGRTAVSGNGASRIFTIDRPAGGLKVDLQGLRLIQGRADIPLDEDGGAILASETDLTLTDCVFGANRAIGFGGAVALDEGTLTAVNTTFSRNATPAGSGGAVFVAVGRFTAQGCNFARNSAGDAGGAALLLGTVGTLRRCTLSGNSSSLGGAILSYAGRLTFNTCTIANNRAEVGGGVAAILGTLTVRDSTLSGNTARGGGVPGVNFGGGGVLAIDATSLIVNSTISGNTDQTAAPGPETGGGGVRVFGGSAVIRNSTIAFNSTVGSGGGVFLSDSPDEPGRLVLQSTIVSNSTAPGGNFDVARPAGQGLASASSSLIRRIQPGFLNDGSINNKIGVNPRLLPLAANGGPTLTHLMAAGSPGVDAGRNPERLQTDQRGPGFPRVKNGRIDIGAVEL